MTPDQARTLEALIASGRSPPPPPPGPSRADLLADERSDQPMTPEISAHAALEWLGQNGWHHDQTGAADRYRGDASALDGYRGRGMSPTYAKDILSWSRAAEASAKRPK